MPGAVKFSYGNMVLFFTLILSTRIYFAAGAYGDPKEEDVNRRVQREEETRPQEDGAPSQETNYNSYHNLHMQIMQGYNRHVRPLVGEGREIVCNFSMVVTHLDTVDEDHQTIDLHGWVILQWFDERLSWNSSSEFRTIPKIVIPQHFVWRPDLHLYNNAESKVDTLVSSNTLAHVYVDGRVVIDPPISLRAYCEFDYSRYPWDTQTCTVALGSWAYRTHELKWSLATSLAENPYLLYRDSQRGYTMNWRITNVSVLLSELIFEAEKWHYINMLFTLKRESGYAKRFIIIPEIITTILTIVAFLFSATRKGLWKLILILAALALDLVHLLALYSRLPPLIFNALPKAVIICLANIFISLISLLIASITTSLSERKDQVPSQLLQMLKLKFMEILCCFSADELEGQSRDYGSRSPNRGSRQQNYRQAIVITNQVGVTKRVQTTQYQEDSDSRPSTPNDSFRTQRSPRQGAAGNSRRRSSSGGRLQNKNAWFYVAVMLDRLTFLVLAFVYAILWIALVAV